MTYARKMQNGNGKTRWQPQLSDGRLRHRGWVPPHQAWGQAWQTEEEANRLGNEVVLYRFRWRAERKAKRYERGIRGGNWSPVGTTP